MFLEAKDFFLFLKSFFILKRDLAERRRNERRRFERE
jgi:hypothetical protein